MTKLWAGVFPLLLLLFALFGCTSTEHRETVSDSNADNDTMTEVQSEIRVGMSVADVSGVLGSPNVVSTDEQQREVWIYDKVATDTVYSKSSGGVSALCLGSSKKFFGVGGAGHRAASVDSAKSLRVLTVIIKFDVQKKVRDFAYHTARL